MIFLEELQLLITRRNNSDCKRLRVAVLVTRETLYQRNRERREREMKPSPLDFFADMDDHGSTVAMDVDVDDVEALELLGEGPIIIDNKLADADFFNSFEDDFDDTDIN